MHSSSSFEQISMLTSRASASPALIAGGSLVDAKACYSTSGFTRVKDPSTVPRVTKATFELRLQQKISHYQCMHGWLLLLREENISLLWRIKYFQTKIVRMMCDPDRRCIVSSDPAVWFCRALLSMYEKQLQKIQYLSFLFKSCIYAWLNSTERNVSSEARTKDMTAIFVNPNDSAGNCIYSNLSHILTGPLRSECMH